MDIGSKNDIGRLTNSFVNPNGRLEVVMAKSMYVKILIVVKTKNTFILFFVTSFIDK